VNHVPTANSVCASAVRAYISVKTKVQQRAMAGEMYRSPGETLYRLIRGEWSCLSPWLAHGSLIENRGPDPQNPKPLIAGIARIYRGLGVSALRSVTTHGLLWTFFDLVSGYIDNLPESPP
jgi:solute carrier family 25 carnitine/acylcarnitine transporter 20/29